MIDDREALEGLLKTHDFEQLVGSIENFWFDAKEQPYDGRSDAGKRSLARDISAFANADGGYILIGFRTKPSTTHFGDEVVAVRPFDEKLVDTDQYRKIADEWIYPVVEGLEIRWIVSRDDTKVGIVAIIIPRQRIEAKPFLIAKTLEATKVVESIFGYAERRADANEPLNLGDFQRALRIGLHYERTLDNRLTSIEELLQNLAEHRETVQPDAEQQIAGRIGAAYEASDFAGDRAMFLSAYPLQVTELRTIFSKSGDSIRMKLERPPVLRSGGWDLATQQPSEIVRGAMVRIRGFRRILDLYRDGTFIAGCLASEGFLAWTSPEQKLNPMGLVEITYSFCCFYEFVLNDMETPPENIAIRLDLQALHKDGVKTKLAPGALNQVFYQLLPDYIHPAPDTSFSIRKQFKVAEFEPKFAAFELLREVYLWFGFEPDKVPYTSEQQGHRLIDVDALRKG